MRKRLESITHKHGTLLKLIRRNIMKVMFQTQEGEGNLISSSAEAKNMFGFGGIIN